MKKILFSILLFCLVPAALAAYKQDTIATRFIHYSDFEEIQKGIYVSPETTAEQRSELIGLLSEAKKRIAKKFGAYTASPVIISSRDPETRKRYSKNSYANASLLPLSDSRAYIVVGENGHNTDVIAHELMHAEVFSRLGYFNQLVNIPVWFNEGVAMQVDFREKYNNTSSRKRLDKLKYGWSFFGGDTDEITQHYSLAKAAVKKMLEHRDTQYLYDILKKIKAGKNFDEFYSPLGEKS